MCKKIKTEKCDLWSREKPFSRSQFRNDWWQNAELIHMLESQDKGVKTAVTRTLKVFKKWMMSTQRRKREDTKKKKKTQTPTGYKLNFWDEKYTRQENNILSTEQEKVILCSQIRKLNTVNTSLLPKLIYRFFFNLNKDFIRLSVEIKLILKFIWKMTWNSQSNFLKNEQICITSRLIIKPQKSGQGYKDRHNRRRT